MHLIKSTGTIGYKREEKIFVCIDKSIPMKNETGATVGMIGSYNNNCSLQLKFIKNSIPFIKESIDKLDINNSSFPLLVADFGSSHGENSVYIMKLLIDFLNEINKINRSYLIIHNDLPTNDWRSLFNILNNQENIYFGLGNGRSFYNQCLPNNSLTIGYSSSSIHWLSKKPCNISNHCISTYANHNEIILFKSQAKQDYRQFLKNRSYELIQNGILILLITSVNQQGLSAFEPIYNLLYKCAKLLPLNDEELFNYTIPVYLRSYEECCDEELFKSNSFELVKSNISEINFEFYDQYKSGDITLEQFSEIQTGFIRCAIESILKETLETTNCHSKEEIDQLINRYWNIYSE
jgi:hypothetical protein